ncbi:GNAT family N-acetyltransferase, partial [Candidatus Frankia alpina]|uniref:GNAT family N-acetyltransferase n=1 Tax=Candidatus Frankia alpina TaxID=2699483 RepID=UPI001F2572EB
MSGRPVGTVTVVAGTPPRAALDLRYEVFVREQGVPADLEYDGLDAAADHAVVLAADGRAVATARLLDQGPRQPSVEPAGVIGRVVVAAAWRGRGLGRLVTAALEGRAGERGLPAVELHAQTRVADFYARQGYRPIGEPDVEPDVEAGIEHVWMRRELLPGLRRARDSDAVALQDLIASAWAQYPGCVLDVDAEEPWLRAPGTAHAATAGEPARALWVIPADPIGPAVMAGPAAMAGPIGGVLGSVAVWDRPATGFPAAPERAEASEWAGWAELKTLYVAAAARRR